MIKNTLVLCYGLVFLLSSAAQANVEVRFSEGAPKDRFTISNKSKCSLKNVTVDLDLSKSQGKLIFDITSAGAGVEVFQPFEVTEGKLRLASGTTVKDGDSGMSLQIESLNPGQRVSFTIDVDDTIPSGALGMIRVAGSEIKGGTVNVKMGKMKPASSAFGSNSIALVPLANCLPDKKG